MKQEENSPIGDVFLVTRAKNCGLFTFWCGEGLRGFFAELLRQVDFSECIRYSPVIIDLTCTRVDILVIVVTSEDTMRKVKKLDRFGLPVVETGSPHHPTESEEASTDSKL